MKSDEKKALNIVIAGAGKVGFSIAQRLCRGKGHEAHNITLIDENLEQVGKASNTLDAMGVHGSCAVPSTLKEAKVGEADVFVAATGNDEANLIASLLARKMGAKHTIARLRNQEYLESGDSLREIMELNLAINPDYVTAEVISRKLQFPPDTQIDLFHDCGLEIATFRIAEGSRLDGLALNKLQNHTNTKVLICCAERKGEFRIPDGNFLLKAGDRISVTAPPRELRKFFNTVSTSKKRVRNVFILGGSRIAEYLTILLQSTGVHVTILEKEQERSLFLAEKLYGADITHSEGADIAELQQNGADIADAFVALTNNDEDNIILSMYCAREFHVPKVISKVNNDKFSEFLNKMFPDSVVSPKNLVAEWIEGYLRGLAHASDKSTIEAQYYLANGKNVTATEFVVGEKAACVGHTLAELELKPGVLLAAGEHDGRVFLPDGGTILYPGDRAIVVTTGVELQNLDDILAKDERQAR